MAALLPKKLLIVEDQRGKSQAIRECLAEAANFQVVETDTIVIAGHLLGTSDGWSGVVLDLSFRRTQQAASQVSRPFLAGLEILQQLNEMRVDVPVVIATQHKSFFSTKYGDFDSIQDLCAMLDEAFPSNFKELIEVDLTGVDWRAELIRAARSYFK